MKGIKSMAVGAESLVFFGLILMALYWVFDAFHDTFLLDSGTFFHSHNLSVHLVIFALQLLLIAVAWRLVGKRRRLEAELQAALNQVAEEKNRSQAIVAALGDGISIQDRDYRVLYQNETHRRMVGGDFLGEACYRVYARRDEVCEGCPVRAAFADGVVHRLLKLNQPGRAPTHLEIVASPLRDPRGEIVAGIELVRDISQHKQAEEALAQQAEELAAANEELEAFSYSLSHDLRNPLTRIYASAQVLEESSDTSRSENEKFLVRNICEASEKMEELIESILALAHVSRSELLREEVNLTALAREISAQLRLLQLDRQVAFVIAPGLTAKGDPRLLKVVLENLLENAWKYTQKTLQARIEVGVEEREGKWVYFVRDNGAGFDMAHAGKLFKPFQRLHPTNEFPGTGIGLATVQRIIHRHGGRIWAEGEPDRGATFYFTLP